MTETELDAAIATLEIPVETPSPADELNQRFRAELDRVATELLPRLAATAPGAAVTPYFEWEGPLRRCDYPETNWLVEGLVKRGGITVIGGEPKTGKSWVLQEIVRALSTGMPAFERFAVQHPARGAYMTAEDLGADVKAHFGALGASARMTEDHWESFDENLLHQTRSKGRPLDLLRDVDLAILIASIRLHAVPGHAVEYVALDPLRNMHSGEEDKSDSMTKVMQRLAIIGDMLGGATVIAVHHAKKGGDGRGGQVMRGSSAIHGAVDSGIYLSGLAGDGIGVITNRVESEVKGARSAGRFTLTLTIRDGSDGRATSAAWSIDDPAAAAAGSPAMEIGDPLVAEVAEKLLLAGGKLAKAAIHAKVRGDRKRKEAAIAALRREGLAEDTYSGRKHDGVRLTAKGIGFARGEPTAPPPPVGDSAIGRMITSATSKGAGAERVRSGEHE